MKVSIKSTLKNITEKEQSIDKTIAKKEKNKITYQINNENYIIKKISLNKLLLVRSNETIECIMLFEKNKKTTSQYHLKEEGYTIEIEIETTYLEIANNQIIIKYNVIDSNTIYELKIEMSEEK